MTSQTRRRTLTAAGVLAAVVGVVLALSVHAAAQAATELERTAGELQAVRETGREPKTVSAALQRARARTSRAQALLDRPTVRVVSLVPVLGRAFRAERAVARASADALAASSVVVALVPDVRADGRGADLRVLDELADRLEPAAARARRSLTALEAVDTAATPQRVTAGTRRAVGGLSPVVLQLESAAQGARLAHGLLGGDGPRRVFVALQNNAELRATGGYASTFATGTASGGRLELDPLRDVGDVRDPVDRPRRVPAPSWYRADHAVSKADTTALVNWGLTPDVPTAASVLASAAGTVLGTRPDVVLLVDVPALGALADLSGSGITLDDGTRVRGAELSRALLVDAYAQAGRAQEARRDALREAATRAAGGVLSSGAAPLDVVRTLGALARGRHVSLWSARRDEQRSLVGLGLGGQVDAQRGDLLAVSVNNFGANKLDQYVDRVVTHEVSLHARTADVVQRLTLTNRTPAGLVPYVAGTGVYGQLRERVQFDLPPRATLSGFTVDGRDASARVASGAPRTRVSTGLVVARGASRTVEVRYRTAVDRDAYRVTLVPQPLVRPAELRLVVQAAPGAPPLPGGTLRREGVFSEQSRVVIARQEPAEGLRARVRRFLRDPVRLG